MTASDGRRPSRAGFEPVAELVDAIDPAPWLDLLDERFGIPPSSFDEYLVFRPNRKWLALVDRGMELPPGAETLSIGMPFLYDRMRDPRLTTAAAVKFGPLATRNVLDLDEGRIDDFTARREIPLDPRTLTGPGWVIGRYRGIVVGLGHARAEGEGFVVLGMVPRSWEARRQTGRPADR